MGDIARLKIPALPLPVQRDVADYLDRQTARVDGIIAARLRTNDLLQLRRQAAIDRVILRNAERVRLKHLVSRITSGPRGWAQYMADAGVLFLRITNVSARDIELDLAKVVYVQPPADAERRRTEVRSGDVLLSITAAIGSVAVARETHAGAAVSQHLALVTPKLCSGEWLAYALSSSDAKAQQDAARYGGTKVQLGLDDVGNIAVPVRDVVEQDSDVATLSRLTDGIRQMQRKVQQQVRMLHGRRLALITAAVNGQLNMREVIREAA